jgi:hypothetical protein
MLQAIAKGFISFATFVTTPNFIPRPQAGASLTFVPSAMCCPDEFGKASLDQTAFLSTQTAK